MIRSKALLFSDFKSGWYKNWSQKLKQTESGRGKFELRSNKFWQNAIITQALHERGVLAKGKMGLGFGVGMERLPALLASIGVKVTATDQDFQNVDARAWDNNQLAHGRSSLNQDGICPTKEFKENVSFRPVDMNNIPKDFHSKFDFLWSNCALGHLGSINNSCVFIERSLACLKPGGWAVHTTEANILSDTDTLDDAGTVFFRQRDLYKLFKILSQKGFIVSPLHFNLGKSPDDLRFTLIPKFGNDFSKILFNGYIATQIVLIIKRPHKTNPISRRAQVIKHWLQYRINLFNMAIYKKRNRNLQRILHWHNVTLQMPASATKLSTVTNKQSIKLASNEVKTIRINYVNDSGSAIFSSKVSFSNVNPITIATDKPLNRQSVFVSKSWLSKNRPLVTLTKTNLDATKFTETEYIEPGASFYLEMEISANHVKKGVYKESFCLIKEGDGVVPSTQVQLSIEVI